MAHAQVYCPSVNRNDDRCTPSAERCQGPGLAGTGRGGQVRPLPACFCCLLMPVSVAISCSNRLTGVLLCFSFPMRPGDRAHSHAELAVTMMTMMFCQAALWLPPLALQRPSAPQPSLPHGRRRSCNSYSISYCLMRVALCFDRVRGREGRERERERERERDSYILCPSRHI